MKERENKSVSFALTEKHEVELKLYAEEQGQFSPFVKRLIFMHKAGLFLDSPMAVEQARNFEEVEEISASKSPPQPDERTNNKLAFLE